MKNEPKMEPKELLEFPGKSRKSAPRRPGTTEERPGTPKRPPRHPTAAKMTSKDPKKSPKAPPNDPKRTPSDALGIQKASKRHPKKHQKDTPKEPKLKMENRCKSHRDSDSTNATLKQQCVDNDLSPAECAERLNNRSLASPYGSQPFVQEFTGFPINTRRKLGKSRRTF